MLIDPVLEQVERDLKAIAQMGLTLKLALNTHCHADHITGTGALKRRLPAVQSVISAASKATADRHVAHGDVVTWAGGARSLRVLSTPGHTLGCVTFVDDAIGAAFTGDALASTDTDEAFKKETEGAMAATELTDKDFEGVKTDSEKADSDDDDPASTEPAEEDLTEGLSLEECVAKANEHKSAGNEHFKASKNREAIACYRLGVRYLTKRLEDPTIVEDKPRDPSKVFFAAWVTVEDEETGEEQTYRLVGSDEIDPKLNWISIDSPMAQALIGKSIDEDANVKTPAGDRCFIVTAIKY